MMPDLYVNGSLYVSGGQIILFLCSLFGVGFAFGWAMKGLKK